MKAQTFFISATFSPLVAEKKYNKSGNGVVKIDLNKVAAFYDVSKGDSFKGQYADKASGFAIIDEEILIFGYVPPTAISPMP